jgi:methanogenic corrinoid protein MtbC1
VSTKTFLQNTRQIQPAVIGISTMMSTTVDKVGTLIETLKKELPQSKIMVGGAFINSKITRSLNADGYAENAATLIEETETVLSTAP